MHQVVLAALGLRGGSALLLGGLAGPCRCQVCLRDKRSPLSLQDKPALPDVPGHPSSLAIPDPNNFQRGMIFALHTCSAGQSDRASCTAEEGGTLRTAIPGSSR